jgi:tetratricopeptide (TPR) repeat protein
MNNGAPMSYGASVRAFWAGVMLLLAVLGDGATPAAATAADTRVAETLAVAIQRCTQLSELVSCDAALSMQPNDADLLLAEADVLVQLKRPGEAIGVYRNAQRAGAQEAVVRQKTAAAQLQRETMVKVCLSQAGDFGVRACEAAWLPGASDEVAMFKRRGQLLQDDSPVAALDAYLSAARLAPRDRDVARALVNLSGSLDAKDAAILTARGAALMTLHRPQDAAISLRQAVKLAPDMLEARNLLRQAEQAAAKGAPEAVGAGVGVSAGGGVAAEPPAGATETSLLAETNKTYSNDAPVTRTQ